LAKARGGSWKRAMTKVRRFTKFPLPILLMIIGMVHGLLYVFLVPPWQHNDEPGHFEYVWLIANRSSWPEIGDYDQIMRREMLSSMYEHGFFRDMSFQPDINAETPWIGLSQVGDPPLYYWLASLPLHLVHGMSIDVQLYASRLVSLVLYLLTILAGWGIVAELTPSRHPLRWMLPISLALLPGFTNLMTAVNSEVGAVAAFSFFLWATARLLLRRISIPSLALVLGSVISCYLTNSTAWLALPILFVVLLMAFFRRGRWRLLAWIILLAIISAGILSSFRWGDAAVWYRRTFQTAPTRVANSQTTFGKYAFQLDLSAGQKKPSIQQPLPWQTARSLGNEQLTFGAWIWSSQPMKAEMLSVACENGDKQRFVFSQQVQTTTVPVFHRFTVTLPVDVRIVWVALILPQSTSLEQGKVFFDGLVLVKGEILSPDPPTFTDANAINGSWDGRDFTNMVRNPSAEQAGAGFQPWANELLKKVIPPYPVSFPSDTLVSISDWKGAGWYYWATSDYMFRSFWARFGWTKVLLLGTKPYRPLLIATLLGMGGAVWAAFRWRCVLPWSVVLILGLSMAGIWAQAILRGIGSIFGTVFIPGAHYAYPAMIPTLLVLNTGWLEILRIPKRWVRSMDTIICVIQLLFFLAYDILSVLTLAHFYYW
jgi:hypothetical protein